MIEVYYAGMPWIEALQELFGDDNFRKMLERDSFQNIPSVNRQQDRHTIKMIYQSLQAYNYPQALATAVEYGWVPQSTFQVYQERPLQGVASETAMFLKGSLHV